MQKVVIIFLFLLLAAALPTLALNPDETTDNGGWIQPEMTEDQPVRAKQSASELFSMSDLSFDQVYDKNKYLIDFIIFLLIFAGITLMVYPQSFGKGHAPLTIGLSLALSLGLIMWEKKNLNGESIFQAFFGTISLVFLIIMIAIFIVLAIVRASGGAGATPFFIFFLLLSLTCLWVIFDPG
ncbi:MAG: hypothetical protein Q7R96_02165, partial [Nanoarchaeota archaeon]|nr:hypothetical protein [Nanoarchaeota archaeon]